jgi:hypothetical protein
VAATAFIHPIAGERPVRMADSTDPGNDQRPVSTTAVIRPPNMHGSTQSEAVGHLKNAAADSWPGL